MPMSEIPDLRVLADVDTPDVLRAAVRRFRRRVAARVGWAALTLIALAFMAIYVYGLARPPISRIGGPTADAVFTSEALEVGGAQVILVQARYFGDYVGLHFISVRPGFPQACVSVSEQPYTPVVHAGSDGARSCGSGVGEDWSYIPRPADQQLHYTVSDGGVQLGSFVLRVPAPPNANIGMEGT
jgi:hypothetical protein